MLSWKTRKEYDCFCKSICNVIYVKDQTLTILKGNHFHGFKLEFTALFWLFNLDYSLPLRLDYITYINMHGLCMQCIPKNKTLCTITCLFISQPIKYSTFINILSLPFQGELLYMRRRLGRKSRIFTLVQLLGRNCFLWWCGRQWIFFISFL